MGKGLSLLVQWIRICLPMQGTRGWSLDREDPLENGMATHASILAWRTLWREKPGGLQSMGSQRVDTTERLTLSFHFELITLSSAQNPPKPSQLTKNKSPSLILIYKSCLIITSLLYTHTHTHSLTNSSHSASLLFPNYFRCLPT